MRAKMAGPFGARHREEIMAAKQDYECHDCARTILKGTRYQHWSFGGRREPWKLCMSCAGRRKA